MARARPSRLLFTLLLGLAACPHAPPPSTVVAQPEAPAAAPAPALDTTRLQLVESWPVETSLDNPDIPDAWQVWVELINGAKERLDIAEFYVSEEPGKRLTPVLDAVRAAAARGVQVRLLADKKFAGTYPETLSALDALDNLEVRYWDGAALAGGVLHAKYFLVDGRVAYVGSQNFDWRSLEHIQELGLRVSDPQVTAAIQDVFDTDWQIAGGDTSARIDQDHTAFPVTLGEGEGAVAVRPAASPKGWLPDEADWDLPALLALVNGAQRQVRVQLLSYATSEKDGTKFPDLDDALRAAAARGVAVELLVADWSKRSWSVGPLQELARVPNITVKFICIPEWSGGFIPFARVAHAKYAVVDGERSWLGTANWGRDYFYSSRNISLFVDGRALAAQLDGFFEHNWDSEYSETVRPGATYTPPRIGQ